jgi:type I restriction enzyme S subunit
MAEVTLGRMRSPDRSEGPNMVPYLRAANVKDGSLDLTDVKSMDFSPAEQAVYALRPGDVLVTEGAGSLAAVGASAVWSGEIDGVVCFQNTLLRLRPLGSTDARFLMWWARHAYGSGLLASVAAGANIYHLGADNVRTLSVSMPSLTAQRDIADYLDAEISAMDDLLAQKRRLVGLLQERIDSAIMELVGTSALVAGDHPVRDLPIRRVLAKLNRPPEQGAPVVTAFRDGQVTARALRRSEGFTESWTEGARVQGVMRGDVVVHGLDGFAGAIGMAEADGVCSPVYHVCAPIDGGDADFYGRMLRLLATTGYLGNFATSTRERAVDFRNWDLFGKIPVPVVLVAEQRRIGNLIRQLHPIRERVSRSESLIRERRQALITAAVTGQLDIPGVAA